LLSIGGFLFSANMSINVTLRKAAKIQETIAELSAQLASLLAKANTEFNSAPTANASAPVRRPGRPPGRAKAVKATNGFALRGRQPKAGLVSAAPAKTIRTPGLKQRSPMVSRKRISSASGPLAPAVVKVLEDKNKPMNVRDIFTDLIANGYSFSTPEPKKNLAARIYRLPGVKQVAPGLFATA
jgi:hypothetical protein